MFNMDQYAVLIARIDRLEAMLTTFIQSVQNTQNTQSTQNTQNTQNHNRLDDLLSRLLITERFIAAGDNMIETKKQIIAQIEKLYDAPYMCAFFLSPSEDNIDKILQESITVPRAFMVCVRNFYILHNFPSWKKL